jgi:glycosyltransferase involved in cell wall biosynthesis
MRILFVPVSAPTGTGEYVRSLAIASDLVRRRPDANIEFVLNRSASYAPDVPFPTTWLPSSPTFHPREVSELIGRFRPNVVVFDNAGRTAQLKAAKAAGARVVFVSSRPRQRRKAFRLKWLPYLDEHWIAWPEFMAGPVSATERLKMRLVRAPPTVRFMDTVMPAPEADVEPFGLAAGHYAVVVPGGGSAHPGALSGPEVMAETAQALARAGHPTLLVGPGGAVAGAGVSGARSPLLHHAPSLPIATLVSILAKARVVVANGGDTLLQALCLRRPCVAAPLARDQVARIRHCSDAGLVSAAELNPDSLARAAQILLNDASLRQRMSERLAQRPLHNGLDVAVDVLTRFAH